MVSQSFSREWGAEKGPGVARLHRALESPVRGVSLASAPDAGASWSAMSSARNELGSRLGADPHPTLAGVSLNSELCVKGACPWEAQCAAACLWCFVSWQFCVTVCPHGALLKAALHLGARVGAARLGRQRLGQGGALCGSRRLPPSHSSAPIQPLVPSSLF